MYATRFNNVTKDFPYEFTLIHSNDRRTALPAAMCEVGNPWSGYVDLQGSSVEICLHAGKWPRCGGIPATNPWVTLVHLSLSLLIVTLFQTLISRSVNSWYLQLFSSNGCSKPSHVYSYCWITCLRVFVCTRTVKSKR